MPWAAYSSSVPTLSDRLITKAGPSTSDAGRHPGGLLSAQGQLPNYSGMSASAGCRRSRLGGRRRRVLLPRARIRDAFSM